MRSPTTAGGRSRTRYRGSVERAAHLGRRSAAPPRRDSRAQRAAAPHRSPAVRDTGCGPSSSYTAIRAGRTARRASGVARTQREPEVLRERAIGPSRQQPDPGPRQRRARRTAGVAPRLEPHTPTSGRDCGSSRRGPSPAPAATSPRQSRGLATRGAARRTRRSWGLAVAPNRGLTESHQVANSDTLVLPSRIAPAARMRPRTTVGLATRVRRAGEPLASASPRPPAGPSR